MTTLSHSIQNQTNECQINDQNKKYSLVKWLVNSEFDVNNEWLGRLTSVPHANIIDFDIEELKAGMEISVFRNSGEIWRAQVIIPKTSSNTIDLPPSSHRVSKIRTKAMGTGSFINGKFNDSIENSIDHSLVNLNDRCFVDLNDFTVDEGPSLNVNGAKNNNATLMLLTNSSLIPSHLNTVDPNLCTSTNKLNKELQFLQKAINDAGLTDFYQTLTTQLNSSDLSLQQSPFLSSTVNNNLNKFQTQENNSFNLETILQLQCELLEQQKEIKAIESETLEELKQLQFNLHRLSKKFDSFESIVMNYMNSNSSTSNNNNLNLNQQNFNFNFKSAKTNLNKLNNSIQQIKIIK